MTEKPIAHCTLEQLAFLVHVIPGEDRIPLYTAPPKREWVGLTEERKLYLAKYWFSAEHDINRAMMLLNHYEEEKNA